MYSMIYTTAADDYRAEEIVRQLLEKRLIGCANIFNIRSMYRREDEIQEDDEIGLIMKTTRERISDLINDIKEIHPYEVPCVLALNIDTGSKGFLRWISDETS